MAAPAPRVWHDGVVQVKAGQMRERRRAGATGGVVFAGSSQVLEGVAPRLAAPGLGLRAYNAGVHRGFLPLTERWLLDVVVPALQPRVVVLGLSVLDLNDNGTAQYEVLERFESALARRRDGVARVQRSLLERWPRLHPLVGRSLSTVVLADVEVGSDGEGLEFADAFEYRLSDTKRRYVEEELLGRFTTGPRTTGSLERVVAGVRRTGAELVLVEMPVTDELVMMLPGGADDAAAARRVLRAEADRHGTRLVESLRTVTDHAWFADCVHLSGAGMCHVSLMLERELAAERALIS